MKNCVNFTIFENIENGTRFYSNYSEDVIDEDNIIRFKIIKHCESSNEAESICNVKSNLNYYHFLKNLSK